MSKYYNIKYRAGIMVAVLLAAIFASCTKNFQKENATWNGSASATLPQLYLGIGSNLDATAQGEDNAGTRWLYPITMQGAVYEKSDYTYGQGANWNGFYQNLAAMNQMFTMMSTSPDSATYTNVKAMLLVLRAYQAIELSNFYGDIPYFKAGKALSGSTTDLSVPYDKQQAIYVSCLKDLTWAVNNLGTGSNQYSLSGSEFLLANNISQWKAFANSLRLRYALTMYDKDNADAGPIIADALTKPLLNDPIADVVGLNATNIPGLGFDNNAAGRGFSFRQECRLRMGSTMWNLMSSNNNADGTGIFDARCLIYFEKNGTDAWAPYPQDPTSPIADGGDPYNVGRDQDWAATTTYKEGNLYSDFNYYWGRDGVAPGANNPIPEIFMTPAEVHFLKAEVYARGIAGVAQDMTQAKAEYNAGISASIIFWTTAASNSSIWVQNKPTPAAAGDARILAVQNNAKTAFNDANAVQLIYAQEWIDLFRQPWVAWTLMRRTGGATPADTDNPAGYTQNYGALQRYQYPSDEQLYNNVNWKAETGGADKTSTKIWVAK
jgi:hypothetical protein